MKRPGLAAARVAAGLTQEDVAAKLGVERTTVYRWESGESIPRPWTRPGLATLLNLDNRQLAALLDGASYESIQSRTETALDEALPATDSPPTAFPSIPSTNDYADVFGSSDELAILATASLVLLGAITSGNVVPQDQASKQLAGLDRLMDMMKRRGILHLLAQLTAGGALASPVLGALGLNPDERERVTRAIISPERVDDKVIGHIETMLWICQRQDDIFGPQVVLNAVLDQQRLVRDILLPGCPQHLRSRMLSLYSNLSNSAGWYFFDLNQFELAWQEFERARKAAHDAQNRELSVYTLCHMSGTASWRGQTHTGLDLAAVAQTLAPNTSDQLLRVCVADKAAQSYATDGEYDKCMKEHDKAQTILAGSAGQGAHQSLAYDYNEGVLASVKSRDLLRLGKSQEALASARAGLALYDKSFARGLAFCTLHLGQALIQCKEIDEAATVIAEAATCATQNGSTRLTKELHTVRAAMEPWQETRAVKELDEQLVGLGLAPASS